MDFRLITLIIPKFALELIEKGGPAMWPLLVLSILSLGTILERLWFWASLLFKERQVVNRVLDAATSNWPRAREIALEARRQPIGRYLHAPLRLANPDPEVFRLALESAADDELALMRQGDKILEAVIALAPLLGLLGTVLGLIHSLSEIRLSELGTASAAASKATQGIGEALIATATGLIIAITSLAFYRLFQAFWHNQVRVFRKSGGELELLYRQAWLQGENTDTYHSANPDTVDDTVDVAKTDTLNSANTSTADVSEVTEN